MASSRLEKLGTVYTRITNLMRAKALQVVDRPLWYDVYAAFPPKREPTFWQPTPNVVIENIFYPEDKVRGRFHKECSKIMKSISLADKSSATSSQEFLAIYNKLEKEKKVEEEKLFESALDIFKTQASFEKIEPTEVTKPSLASTFKDAQHKESLRKSVDLKDIFKN